VTPGITYPCADPKRLDPIFFEIGSKTWYKGLSDTSSGFAFFIRGYFLISISGVSRPERTLAIPDLDSASNLVSGILWSSASTGTSSYYSSNSSSSSSSFSSPHNSVLIIGLSSSKVL